MEKVAFYICEENAHLSYWALEVHKQKAHVRFDFDPLGSSKNYQITLDKSSVLTLSLIPLISSLCSLNKFPNLNTKKSIPCKLGFLKMQNKKKKTSEYSKMIELQDEIEAECVNNTKLWVRSYRRTLPNQTLRLWLQLWSHFRSPSPSLSATRRFRTPPPHLRCALRCIYVARTWMGRYWFCQEPTDEVLREKGEREKKKKRDEEGELWMFWSLEERRIKKKRERVRVWRIKKRGKKKEKERNAVCGG